MDMKHDLEEAEQKANKDLDELVDVREVSEAKLLSENIVKILLNDLSATDRDSVEYSSGNGKYVVSFGFVEAKMPDGKLGVFEEIPDDETIKNAETVGFTVMGLHPKKEVEADFHSDSVAVMPGTELRRIYDFQLSVLRSASK